MDSRRMVVYLGPLVGGELGAKKMEMNTKINVQILYNLSASVCSHTA